MMQFKPVQAVRKVSGQWDKMYMNRVLLGQERGQDRICT